MELLDDNAYMRLALDEARAAASVGEVPVGAVLVSSGGQVIARAANAPIANHDPSAHAEIRALRSGGAAVKNYRLQDTSLYVTLEPCAMCAGAISLARIGRLVIAAADQKGGAVWHGPKFFKQPTCHWAPEIIQGPFGDIAGGLLKDFFQARRR